VLNRESIQRCPHSLDLDVPAGPRLSVGFIPARTNFHSVFMHDLDRTWAAEQPFVNSYYLLVTAAAPPGEAFRQAVRLHWEKFGRQELATAAPEQAGTDTAYKSLGLWDDWRNQVWEKESRVQWLAVHWAMALAVAPCALYDGAAPILPSTCPPGSTAYAPR
jgi:hypothetical protein